MRLSLLSLLYLQHEASALVATTLARPSRASSFAPPESSVVVGAGPAGLATAIMLSKRGWQNVQVIDRLPPPPSLDDDVWSERRYELYRQQCEAAAAAVPAILCRRKANPIGMGRDAAGESPATPEAVRSLLRLGKVRLSDANLPDGLEEHEHNMAESAKTLIHALLCVRDGTRSRPATTNVR